jgi:hypothetical protein
VPDTAHSHAGCPVLTPAAGSIPTCRSMVNTEQMGHLLARLQEIHNCKSVEEMLTKVLIVLVGDMAQVSNRPGTTVQ